jgi:hypothetical protein
VGQLPEGLATLGWLVGRWGGIGEGQYPTMAPFRYEQVVEFASDGRPFLEYRAVSWIVDEQNQRLAPHATESGYVRPLPENALEMMLAHPTGRVEVWVGHIEVTAITDARVTGARIEMTTDAVVRTETGEDVSAGHRLLGLVDGRLLTTFDMAAAGHPLSNHLAVALEPIPADLPRA